MHVDLFVRSADAGRDRHNRHAGPRSPLAIVAGLILTFLFAAVVTPRGAGPVTLAVPNRSNANATLAARGSFVAAAWSASDPGGSTDIYSAVSRDAGVTFSTPVRVNATPGDARVNGEQPPRLALISRQGRSPAIVVVWTSKRTAGTTLLTARSDDEGRTFGEQGVVPGGEAAGNRGWESIVADGRGGVHALWLDHRDMAAGSSAASHAGHDSSSTAKKDGVAMAQLSKLFVATLGEPSSARAITAGVCYCCKTAMAAGANGRIYAAWRHVYPGNLRDIAFTVSPDNGRTFGPVVRVSEDRWQLDGCPDDGPAMVVDARNRVHVVWPTLVTETNGQPAIALFYASSSDGRAFTPRQRLPTDGAAHHPQVALAGDGSLAIAWDELKDGRRRIATASGVIDAGGAARFRRQVIGDDESGSFPMAQGVPGGALVAWTSGPAERSVIRVLLLDHLGL